MTILGPDDRAKRVIELLKGYKDPIADSYVSYYERNGELPEHMLEAAENLERRLDKQRLIGDI
jgi:type II secretory pathway component PulF